MADRCSHGVYRIPVEIPPDDYSILENIAEARGEPVSAVIEGLVHDMLFDRI